MCCGGGAACQPIGAARRSRADMRDARLLRTVLAARTMRRSGAPCSPRGSLCLWLAIESCYITRAIGSNRLLSVLHEAGANPPAVDTSLRGCESLFPLHFVARPAMQGGFGRSFNAVAARCRMRPLDPTCGDRLCLGEHARTKVRHQANSTCCKLYFLDSTRLCEPHCTGVHSSHGPRRIGLSDDCRPMTASEADGAAVRRFASFFHESPEPHSTLVSAACERTNLR
jgi:hypothetical protein